MLELSGENVSIEVAFADIDRVSGILRKQEIIIGNWNHVGYL